MQRAVCKIETIVRDISIGETRVRVFFFFHQRQLCSTDRRGWRRWARCAQCGSTLPGALAGHQIEKDIVRSQASVNLEIDRLSTKIECFQCYVVFSEVFFE